MTTPALLFLLVVLFYCGSTVVSNPIHPYHTPVHRHASSGTLHSNVCDSDGWRPPFNTSFPVDDAPSPFSLEFEYLHMPIPNIKPLLFPNCTHYVAWTMPPDSSKFEDTKLCQIVPFEHLRRQKFDINCSAWDQGKGLALSRSAVPAPVSRFASVMWACQDEQPRFFKQFLATNLCSTSSRERPYEGSLVSGCMNTAPVGSFRFGNAVLTHVKFVKSNPEENSCVDIKTKGPMRMTAVAWTGVDASSVSGVPPPARQCIWRQQGMGDVELQGPYNEDVASLEVAWEHGALQSVFKDSGGCPPDKTRPFLLVVPDAYSHLTGNYWHSWHNVMFASFAALFDSGMLKCDDVTGACSVSSPFDVLHLIKNQYISDHRSTTCDAFSKLFGVEGMSCLSSTDDIEDKCYSRVIVQSSARSNPHIYSSGDPTILRLFSRAVQAFNNLVPLTPAQVQDRPAHVVLLVRRYREGFDANSILALKRVMTESGIPFTALECFHHTRTDDIAVIRSATVLIGATGAAFTNTWHLTKGAVVVLAHTGKPWYECYYFKAQTLDTGSTFIRWTPSQQNYSLLTNSGSQMYPYQNEATWRTVLRTALLQQDDQAKAHPRVAAFLKHSEADLAPQDRRCNALLMVYKPKNRM